MKKDSINRLIIIPIILFLLGIILFIYGYIALAPAGGGIDTPFFPLVTFFTGIFLIPIGLIGLIFLMIKKRKAI